MSHNHILYDSDPHFKIDADTRKITNESTRKTSLIQHDHNSERFTFEVKRYIEGHDLLSCNIVEIHYINVEYNTKLTHVGVYTVDDLQTKEGDEDTLVCSWKVGRNATRLVGQLQFILRFSCVDDTGNVVYVWNTGVYNGITISSGIYNIDSDSDNPVPAYNFVTTINGDILKFFVGTQAQYDDLSDSAKQNLFAIITDEKINIPLIAQYTLESTKSIAEIMNKFSGTFNINHFNRTPVIGDTFYVIGSNIDDVSFTMTALITGFTGDGLYATFTAIEVVPIKAIHAQDAITLYGGTSIHEGDLNDYTIEGNYYISSNDSVAKVANVPTINAGSLKVLSGIGKKNNQNVYGYILQIYISHACEMYVRHYQIDADYWCDWKQFAGDGSRSTYADVADEAIKLTYKSLPANTDLNDVKEDRLYMLGYGNGYANLPEGFISGWLDVKKAGDEYVIQTLTGAYSMEWARFYNGITWSKWTRCVTAEELKDTANPFVVEKSNNADKADTTTIKKAESINNLYYPVTLVSSLEEKAQTIHVTDKLLINPTTGALKAPRFEGKADSAMSADYASENTNKGTIGNRLSTLEIAKNNQQIDIDNIESGVTSVGKAKKATCLSYLSKNYEGVSGPVYITMELPFNTIWCGQLINGMRTYTFTLCIDDGETDGLSNWSTPIYIDGTRYFAVYNWLSSSEKGWFRIQKDDDNLTIYECPNSFELRFSKISEISGSTTI